MDLVVVSHTALNKSNRYHEINENDYRKDTTNWFRQKQGEKHIGNGNQKLDKKITLLILLWILDKIIMLIMLYLMR